MNEDDVKAALRTVSDPEAGMSVPACGYIVDEAAAAIRAVAPEGTDVEVRLVWDPP